MIRKLLFLPIVALSVQAASAQDIRAAKPLANPVLATPSVNQDQRVYELRTYFASQGKLDDLHNRFKNHLLGFQEKYGITSLGFWVPTDNPKRMIVALVSYPNMEERERSWARLAADADWIQTRRLSEMKGRIVDAVREEILTADQAADVLTFAAKADRSFEIRRFTAESGKAEDVKLLVRDQMNDEYGNKNAVIRFFSPTGEGNRTTTTLMAFIVRPTGETESSEFVTTRGGISTGGGSSGTAVTRIPGEIVITLKPTEYSPSK